MYAGGSCKQGSHTSPTGVLQTSVRDALLVGPRIPVFNASFTVIHTTPDALAHVPSVEFGPLIRGVPPGLGFRFERAIPAEVLSCIAPSVADTPYSQTEGKMPSVRNCLLWTNIK